MQIGRVEAVKNADADALVFFAHPNSPGFSPLLAPHCSLRSFACYALLDALICLLAALIHSLAAIIRLPTMFIRLLAAPICLLARLLR